MKKTYAVTAIWDDEAEVWVATSEDVPGLATEASTLEKLMKKLNVMVPELLEANGIIRPRRNVEIPYTLISRNVAHYEASHCA